MHYLLLLAVATHRQAAPPVKPKPATIGWGASARAPPDVARSDRAAGAGNHTEGSVDATTLAGKLLFGYQGWFDAPGSGSPNGPGGRWVHWSPGVEPDEAGTAILHRPLAALHAGALHPAQLTPWRD